MSSVIAAFDMLLLVRCVFLSSFIAAFDGKTLTFGKVGKVVNCEVARSKPLVSRDSRDA
jgi:hypothetical protein